jgi:probable phosphoglycerate mutase
MAAHRLLALGETLDAVVASPLLRARQTAEVITSRLGLASAAVEQAWAEASFGDWEGLTVEQVQARFPGSWERLIGDPVGRTHGGESLNDVRLRVLRAWDGLWQPGRTTLVVTHLTPIRIIVAAVLGIPHESFPRVLAEPGSMTVVDRWRDGGAVLRAVGERPA